MQIQILVPSQNQRRFSLQVGKTDTVLQLRTKIAKIIEVPEKEFMMIALGKIVKLLVYFCLYTHFYVDVR